MAVAGHLWDLETFSQTGNTAEPSALPQVFSPDGKWTAKDDRGTPEVTTLGGQRIARLASQTEGGFVIAFGPAHLVLTSGDKTLRLWDLSPRFTAEFTSWRSTFTVDISDEPRVYATSDASYEYREGKSVPVVGRDNAITLWSPEGRTLGEFPTRSGNRGSWFALSRHAGMLAVCYQGSPAACRLWDTKTRQSTDIQLHGKAIGIVTVSGKPALVSMDGVVLRVQDGAGAARPLFSLPPGTDSVELNTKRTQLIAASPSGVSVWDLTGLREGGFEKALAAGSKVLPGSDIQRVGITASGELSEPGDVSIYDKNGKLIAAFEKVRAAALSPDGKLLATSGGFYSVPTLWDVETKRPVARFPGNGDFQLRFTPDGKFVTVVGNDAPPRLWPVDTTEELVTAACQWIDDYLRHNSNVSAEDRKLCGP